MEQIISASGTQHGLIVNPDGSLNNNLIGFSDSFIDKIKKF